MTAKQFLLRSKSSFQIFCKLSGLFQKEGGILLGECYGYIRVSEKKQNLQRQWKIMTEQESIPPKYI